MNVAFVNSTHRWGGVKTWILDFSEELHARNNIHIWGRPGPFVESARAKGLNATAVTFGPDFNPMSVIYFLRAFKEANIDVLIVNVGKDMTTAAVAAKLLGIPVVQQIGLPADIPHTLKMESIHKWMNPWFLCSCEFIRDGFVDSLPYIKPDMTKVILTAKRCADTVTPLGSPMQIIMTSQLNLDKDHATILRAVARLKGDFRLRILGTGRCESQLKALAKELGVSDKVEWCGFMTDVKSQLRAADVFILASRSEGLPNTLQEAMAEGLVPVCRDVGGCREVWPDGLQDLMLHYDADAEDFRRVLQDLLDSDAEKLQSLKSVALAACQDYFSLSRKAAELEKWLAGSVLAGKA
jgi:Glycosyltransferase